MTITHFGGAREVGATSYLVEVWGVRFLVDAGMRPDNAASKRLKSTLPDWRDLGRLDFALVTHAHFDHIGALPILVRHYPDVSVYATPQTRDVIQVMLEDSIKIMQAKADLDGSRKLYTHAEMNAATAAIMELAVGNRLVREIGDTLIEVRPISAGHILGACSFLVRAQNRRGEEVRLLLMGDVSGEAVATIKPFDVESARVFAPHLVVTESTYGMEKMLPITEEREAMRRMLLDQVIAGGHTLIPAFALGRAQELTYWIGEWNLAWDRYAQAHGLDPRTPDLTDPEVLAALKREPMLPDTPCIIDGMARTVNDLCEAHPDALSDLVQERYAKLGCSLVGRRQLGTAKAMGAMVVEKALARPSVVLAPSGMAVGGRILDWMQRYAGDPATVIAFSGYLDCESPGGRLTAMYGAEPSERTLRYRDTKTGEQVTIPVCGPMRSFRLRAHMTGQELLATLTAIAPQQIIVAHGDVANGQALVKTLKAALPSTAISHPQNREAVACVAVVPDQGAAQITRPRSSRGGVAEQYAYGTSAPAVYAAMRRLRSPVHDPRDVAVELFGVANSPAARAIGAELVLQVLDVYQDIYFEAVREWSFSTFRPKRANALPFPRRTKNPEEVADDLMPWALIPSGTVRPGLVIVRHLAVYPRLALLGPAINASEHEAVVAMAPSFRVRRSDVLTRVADFPTPNVEWWVDRGRWDYPLRAILSAYQMEARLYREPNHQRRHEALERQGKRLVTFDNAARSLAPSSMTAHARQILSLLATTMAYLGTRAPVVSLPLEAIAEYLRVAPRSQADSPTAWRESLIRPINEVRRALGMHAVANIPAESWPFYVEPLWQRLGDVSVLDTMPDGSDSLMERITAAIVDAEILTHATAHLPLQAARNALA